MRASRRISVVGLGYVGLPVAAALGRRGYRVVAFDIDPRRVEELSGGHDRTGEVRRAELEEANLILTCDEAALAEADFHIVTVPTPIDEAHRPDLRPLVSASLSVGRHLKQDDIVVYESTVYPGATERVCVPILEQASGLSSKTGFRVGYSPERINPGDREHRLETITKVVSAQDEKTLDVMAEVYGSIIQAGVHRAPNIQTAEAAKIIENTQRDLNIALMNELALIFHKIGIDTQDVLDAAATKWNFLRFSPGLVGGHCIGVDPYYLTHRAEEIGYHPEVILSGRRINDGMGLYVARETVKRLLRRRCGPAPCVTVLGVTFKEDVPDVRNTRVTDIVEELRSYGMQVQVHDPLIDADIGAHELGIAMTRLEDLVPSDAVILAVPHRSFRQAGWSLVNRLLPRGGLVVDVKSCLDRTDRPDDVELWRL